jgi:hypothetical protein
MATTRKIPPDQLEAYFDAFTKRFLRDGSPEAIDVEIVAPTLGAQYLADGARLLGITYDRKKNSLELELDAGDHRIVTPAQVWVMEEADEFVSAIELIAPDGRRDIATIRRVGLRPLNL